jgi:hypothetical protein
MFWDYIANFYDFFENLYNSKVNQELCKKVAERMSSNDNVLECACGTGMISIHIATKCRSLIATDFSQGMLAKSRKRCKKIKNIRVEKANILQLEYPNESFNKVVAANVIHLLDQPDIAISELIRVCKKGGKIIIPTYIIMKEHGISTILIRLINHFTKTFLYQFNEQSYKNFFNKQGYSQIDFEVINGRTACCIAVITK